MSCAAGFISIVDPFLNPDRSAWTGSIVYTLLINSTAAGATVVGARQQFDVSTTGINICLAPGLYAVTLNQSGVTYAVTSQWTVPNSGGPYTVAEISSSTTLWFPSASGEIIANVNGTVEGCAGITTPDGNSLEISGSLTVDNASSTYSEIGPQTTAYPAPAPGNSLYVGMTETNPTSPLRPMVAAVEYSGTSTFTITAIDCVASDTTTAGNYTGSSGPFGVVALLEHVGSGTWNGGLIGAAAIAARVLGKPGSGPIINCSAFAVPQPEVETGTTWTNYYGLYVQGGTVGSGTITNRWGVYVQSDPSYFGGGIEAPLTTPASSSATGTAGQIEWDANYIYVCTATNTWKRAALASF